VVTKTRIHDLAAEFGIDSEQVMRLLAELGIHVRSHLSALDAGQVALVRARWERERRKRTETPAPAGRRRAAKGTKRSAAAAAPAPAEARPKRRRRTAAEVAEIEAAEEERQREAAAVAADQELRLTPPVVEPKPSLEERAAALFKAPPAPADVEEPVAEPETAEAEPAEPAQAVAPTPEAVPARPKPEPVIPRRIPRPAATAWPKPVASATPGVQTPRPVASAAPGELAEDRRRDKKKRKKGKRTQVDQEAVQANISRTMASLKGPAARKGVRRRGDEPSGRELEEQRRAEERELEKTTVRVNEFITVSELSNVLNVSPTQIVTFCFKELGMMVTVNQRLDFDQIELIASAFDFRAVREEEYAAAAVEGTQEDKAEDLVPRPPVVTVMGHVDHGKTSLLDHLRKTNVIAGEAGGITQHIGAYHVTLPSGKGVTFLDTPGHQAFTAMRARGAQVTDLVVLVVAADDQVMPQTVEAISHAKNAGVPLVVAINKIDLPTANPQKVKQGLLQHGVVVEEFGGDTMAAEISAKAGSGIDELLDKILLQAEMLDKRANPNRPAHGTVIESTLDPGKGPVATVLVQSGTLEPGQDFICGSLAGRVRAMFDERGSRVEKAGPSMPVQVLGFDSVPEAGDSFAVVAQASDARDIAQKRQRLEREAHHRRSSRGVSLEDLAKDIGEGKAAALKIIIKADQGGPAEALADAFAQLSTAEVKVEVVHRGVGGITESDVLLAKTAHAIVVGFHVRPDANSRAAAEREKVDIRTYRVIYDAIEDVRAALEGLLAPERKELVLGEAEVRQIFKISGVGTIAGCFVRSGVIRRGGGARIRVLRDAVIVYDGDMASLKRFKDDVKEVKEGLECGIGIQDFNDVKVGDVLEAYRVEEVARSLQPAGVVKEG